MLVQRMMLVFARAQEWLSGLQAQYSPMTAEAGSGGEAPPTLAAFRARAAQDKQITVRDVWGLMLHSVKGVP